MPRRRNTKRDNRKFEDVNKAYFDAVTKLVNENKGMSIKELAAKARVEITDIPAANGLAAKELKVSSKVHFLSNRINSAFNLDGSIDNLNVIKDVFQDRANSLSDIMIATKIKLYAVALKAIYDNYVGDKNVRAMHNLHDVISKLTTAAEAMQPKPAAPKPAAPRSTGFEADLRKLARSAILDALSNDQSKAPKPAMVESVQPASVDDVLAEISTTRTTTAAADKPPQMTMDGPAATPTTVTAPTDGWGDADINDLLDGVEPPKPVTTPTHADVEAALQKAEEASELEGVITPTPEEIERELEAQRLMDAAQADKRSELSPKTRQIVDALIASVVGAHLGAGEASPTAPEAGVPVPEEATPVVPEEPTPEPTPATDVPVSPTAQTLPSVPAPEPSSELNAPQADAPVPPALVVPQTTPTPVAVHGTVAELEDSPVATTPTPVEAPVTQTTPVVSPPPALGVPHTTPTPSPAKDVDPASMLGMCLRYPMAVSLTSGVLAAAALVAVLALVGTAAAIGTAATFGAAAAAFTVATGLTRFGLYQVQPSTSKVPTPTPTSALEEEPAATPV